MHIHNLLRVNINLGLLNYMLTFKNIYKKCFCGILQQNNIYVAVSELSDKFYMPFYIKPI